MRKFAKAFRRLPDPRAANARHDLLEVLVIALAATLCGAESCSDMADFGESKEELLRLFLRLEHGVPSHDTFSRVFRLIKPEPFEKAFRCFMAAFAKANGLKLSGVVAVDGKALRGAYERGSKATPLHLVNVFAVEARMALAQHKAPGRNETAGALEVLELLSLGGCIVTADALHCTRAFAATVLERGGDYALVVKANHRPLFKSVTQRFTRSGVRSSTRQIEGSTHDRSETRSATIMRNTYLAEAHRFPGIAAIGRVTLRRRVRGKPADKPLVRYYVLSKYMSPKKVLAGYPQPLGHREPTSLGARRSFRRGSQSSPKGQCPRELRYPPQACPQRSAVPSARRLDPAQNKAFRMGRCLPPRHARSNAIALPRGAGEGTAGRECNRPPNRFLTNS